MEVLKLVEISKLYYEQELTQAQIAKSMKISRPAISKLLSEARRLGIVRIEIKSPVESNSDLVSKIKVKFKLKGGLIIPKPPNEALMFRIIISQAAKYLESQIHFSKKIGLGWCHTIASVVDELKANTQENDRQGMICPLMGSAQNALKWFQTNELARIVAEKTGYIPFYLHAPAFPLAAGDRQLFIETKEYSQISDMWQDLDMAILGIEPYPSVPDQATAARFGDLIKELKPVGMIATYLYDINGKLIESDNDIVIRIPLSSLKKAKRVLAIGPSEKGVASTLGALRTGLITHLITDEVTAEHILQMA